MLLEGMEYSEKDISNMLDEWKNRISIFIYKTPIRQEWMDLYNSIYFGSLKLTNERDRVMSWMEEMDEITTILPCERQRYIKALIRPLTRLAIKNNWILH
jgi:hypothetical protein